MELRPTLPLTVLLAVYCTASPAQQRTPGNPSLTTQTTNVVVPALVRDAAGKVVYTLRADDFVLTDDGVAQKLTLQLETGNEPLALVVVIEAGGAGSRQFQKYERLVPPLAPMLPSIVGNVYHRVAVVTFDSRPNLIQSFTSDLDEAESTLRGLSTGCSRHNQYDTCNEREPPNNKPTGDNGAATLDSLVFAVNLLRAAPSGYRRVIL